MSRAQKVSAHDSMAAPAGRLWWFGGQQELRQPSVQHPPPKVSHPELPQVEHCHRGEPDAAYASCWRGDRRPALWGGALGVGGQPGAAAEAGPGAGPTSASTGRVDVVRILTSGNRLAASWSSSRAFPSRPTSSRTNGPPLQSSRETPRAARAVLGFQAPSSRRSSGQARSHGPRRPRQMSFPTPRTPTSETTEWRSQASVMRFCQNLREPLANNCTWSTICNSDCIWSHITKIYRARGWPTALLLAATRADHRTQLRQARCRLPDTAPRPRCRP